MTRILTLLCSLLLVCTSLLYCSSPEEPTEVVSKEAVSSTEVVSKEEFLVEPLEDGELDAGVKDDLTTPEQPPTEPPTSEPSQRVENVLPEKAPEQPPEAVIERKLPSEPPTTSWVKSSLSQGGFLNVEGMTLDQGGNVYVVGSYSEGNVALGGTTLTTSRGKSQMFVAKLNNKGEFQWATSSKGGSREYAMGVGVSSKGVYVVGSFWETTTLGSNTLSSQGGTDIFVAALTLDGKWQWAHRVGSSDNDEGNGLALDSLGNIYITGEYARTVTFGSTQLTSSIHGDGFVAKLDPLGNWNWVRRYGNPDNFDKSTAILVGKHDDVYVTGMTSSKQSTFGSFTFQRRSDFNGLFVAKLDTKGNWVWAKVLKDSDTVSSEGKALAEDQLGNIYVAGTYHDSFTFGTSTFRSADNSSDFFVAKLTPNGNFVWAQRGGSKDTDQGLGVAVDSGGYVWVTGSVSAGAMIGRTSFSVEGKDTFTVDVDMFVAKLNSHGDWLWAAALGSGGNPERGNCIVRGPKGSLFIAGQVVETTDFQGSKLSFKYNVPRMFVWKLQAW